MFMKFSTYLIGPEIALEIYPKIFQEIFPKIDHKILSIVDFILNGRKDIDDKNYRLIYEAEKLSS